MAQTQLQRTQSACTQSNNGGFKILLDNINHWETHGDWEPLAYLLMNHREKSTLKRVVGCVLHKNIKFITGKEAKGTKWGAKFEKNGANSICTGDKQKLEALVKKGSGIKGKIKVTRDGKEVLVTAHTHYFPSAKPKSDKAFNADDWAKRQAAAHPDSIQSMILALQEQAKKMKSEVSH